MSTFKDRSILIIGGAGYIGSVLSTNLIARGYSVRVLDDFIYSNAQSIAELFDHPRFTLVKGDFCDPDVLKQALKGMTDVVLLAALVGDPISKKYPVASKKINQEGPVRLFELAQQEGIDRFIFASTCSNYGLMTDGALATEASPLNPQSLYAEAKVAVEHFLLEQKGRGGPCTSILRLATAFGLSKRMRFDLTVSEFTRALVLGEDLVVYDENTWRPYCHLRDIGAAIIATLLSPKENVNGEVFNVGSDEGNFTKRGIIDLIRQHVKTGTVSYKTGGTDPRNYRVSFKKITEKLGFKAEFSLAASVPKLAQALQSGAFSDFVPGKTSFYGNYSIPKFE